MIAIRSMSMPCHLSDCTMMNGLATITVKILSMNLLVSALRSRKLLITSSNTADNNCYGFCGPKYRFRSCAYGLALSRAIRLGLTEFRANSEAVKFSLRAKQL